MQTSLPSQSTRIPKAAPGGGVPAVLLLILSSIGTTVLTPRAPYGIFRSCELGTNNNTKKRLIFLPEDEPQGVCWGVDWLAAVGRTEVTTHLAVKLGQSNYLGRCKQERLVGKGNSTAGETYL